MSPLVKGLGWAGLGRVVMHGYDVLCGLRVEWVLEDEVEK